MKYVSSKRLPELIAAWARGEVFCIRVFAKAGEVVRVRTNYDEKMAAQTDQKPPHGQKISEFRD